MKVYQETDVQAATQTAANVLKVQIGTAEEAEAFILGILHAELPEIFPAPAPPPAPAAATPAPGPGGGTT